MANQFTRAYLLLTWASDANKYAFPVFVEGYSGDRTPYAKQLSRNLSGTLLVVRAPADKKEFMGNVWLDHDISGTVVYDAVTYTYGTGANLKSAMEATDLKAKSFDDSSFWDAENVSPWDPRIEGLGHHGNNRIQALRLIER